MAYRNYPQLLTDTVFWQALAHSFIYLLVTPTLIFLCIILAIIVNRKLPGINAYRALYYIPVISGSIAVGISWRMMFDTNGLLNGILLSMGVIKEPVQWLAEPAYTLPIAMLLTTWMGLGYYMMIFLAGLQNIPEELYDAAVIDGCNAWQKHMAVSIPGLRPQITMVPWFPAWPPCRYSMRFISLRTAGRHPRQRCDHGILPVEVGLPPAACRYGFSHRHGAAGGDAGIFGDQYTFSGTWNGGFIMALNKVAYRPVVVARQHQQKAAIKIFGWYVLLTLIALVTIFPFVWVFFTSLKGPATQLFCAASINSSRPHHRQLYPRVGQLPIASFFANSVIVATSTVVLNLLVTSLAAYPLAKMKFRGRDVIFYLLLATFIIPPQLTSIPSFVLAVKVFKYYDQITALIFPSLATVFNIFMLRQAFKAVPNDLIEAGKIDGAGELRIWWDILLPVVRPTLATAAIITFVQQWNDFFWPSLMLHTREHMTLQVGLAALQGMFASDMRGTAAGVTMTVIPILIFFVVLQKYFVRGLGGAVKG